MPRLTVYERKAERLHELHDSWHTAVIHFQDTHYNNSMLLRFVSFIDGGFILFFPWSTEESRCIANFDATALLGLTHLSLVSRQMPILTKKKKRRALRRHDDAGGGACFLRSCQCSNARSVLLSRGHLRVVSELLIISGL